MNAAPKIRPDRLSYLATQAPLPLPAEIAVRVAVTVTKWTMRARTRRALRRLEPHHLEDIGLTPEEAWRESALPFWIS